MNMRRTNGRCVAHSHLLQTTPANIRDRIQSKFMTLQTTHNTTTTSLQRELDTLRKEHQSLRVEMRELEMGNDDLERNERVISSSLADAEQRFTTTLEEKLLLEQELLNKAALEEESQRLKDELRGARRVNTAPAYA